MSKQILAILKYIKNFKLNSIFIRNSIVIMLIVLMPVTAISYLFLSKNFNSVYDEINLVNSSSLSTARMVIDTIMNEVELLAVQTSLNQDVQSYVLSHNSTELRAFELQQALMKYIRNFTNIYKYIHSIYIYSESNGMVIENQNVIKYKNLLDYEWLSLYEQAGDNETKIIPRRWGNTYPRFITVMRTIGVDEVGKMGCVIINVDVEQLKEVIKDIDASLLYSLYITDSENRILYSDDSNLVGKSAAELEYLNKILSRDIQTEGININGKKYVTAVINSNKYNWKYISILSTSYFNDTLKSTKNYAFIMVIFLLFSIIIIAILISLKVFGPIHSILDVLNPTYDIDSITNPNVDKNEIDLIIKSIKKSIGKNIQLEAELKCRMLLLNKAQVASLQAQINPHFLNNILESINWTCIDLLGEDNRVSAMIKALSVLFDISLDTENFLIPISDELKHANIYIYIMSMRYENDINFSWEIHPDIQNYKMIKLTLQPILENAVYHGIKPKRGHGNITIKGEFYKDGILFSVTDDGVGIEPERLEEIQKGFTEENIFRNTQIGIKNVNQRIKLLFGSEYGISIESQKGTGTVVNVYIPKLT